MPVKLRESASIVALAIVIGAVLLSLDYSFLRKKTFLEKNHLKCLTGITTEDRNFLKESFGIRSIYIDWRDSFPSQRAKKVASEGSMLMITWEPYLKEEREKSILAEVVSGKYDRLIGDFAVAAKNFAGPVLLRWGHEVNGNWYSWSGSYNESSLYIEAYRHIYGIFEKNDCQNVKFIFSVNYIDMPSKRWNKFENYYPGRQYVDIIGLDVYNWGDRRWWSKWHHPKKLIKDAYRRAVKLDKTKPVILSEVASCSSGGDKAQWLVDLMDVIEDKFTAIKAFVWFDWKKECNWKMTEDERLFRVYKKRKENGFFSDEPKEFYEVFKI
jgi:hypothetical protein